MKKAVPHFGVLAADRPASVCSGLDGFSAVRRSRRVTPVRARVWNGRRRGHAPSIVPLQSPIRASIRPVRFFWTSLFMEPETTGLRFHAASRSCRRRSSRALQAPMARGPMVWVTPTRRPKTGPDFLHRSATPPAQISAAVASSAPDSDEFLQGGSLRCWR